MNQESIRAKLLEHSRSPKNGCFPTYVDLEAKKTNPLCGDHVELKLHTSLNTIKDIGFKVQACAICSASASIMCEEVKGKTVEKALETAHQFETCLLQSQEAPWPSHLHSLIYFEHLRVTPSRKMCGLLPWVVLRSALNRSET